MARLSRKQKLRKKHQLEAKQVRLTQQATERAKKEAANKATLEREDAEYNALPEEERHILEQLRELRGWLSHSDFIYPAPKFFEENNITELEDKRVLYVLTNLGPYGFWDGVYAEPMKLNWGVFQLACQGCGFEGSSERLLETLARLKSAIQGFQFTPPPEPTSNGLIVLGEHIEFAYSRYADDQAASVLIQFTGEPTGLLAERCMALVENGDLRLVEAGTFGEGDLDTEFEGFVGDVSQITYFKTTYGEPMDFSVTPTTPEQLDEIYECGPIEKLTVRFASGQELALTAEANVDFWVEPA